MSSARKPWIRGAVSLTVLGVLTAAVLISPVGAARNLTKAKVKKIATKVFDQKADELKDKCPAGTVPVAGGCLEAATRGMATWFDANKTCSSIGRRMASAGELIAGFATAGVTPAGNAAADIHIDDNGTMFTQRMIFVTAGGTIGGQADLNTVVSYRCIAPMTNT